MQNPRDLANIEGLLALSKASAFVDLAQAAGCIATDAGRSQLERGAACALWGYSLLRLDPHKNHYQARELASKAGDLLPSVRHADPGLVDGLMLTVGLSWQLLNDHVKATGVFESVLNQSDAGLIHRIKAGFSRAFSLDVTGHTHEALVTYRHLAQELDALPEGALTHSLRRDRQRICLNVADYHLDLGQFQEAEAELARLDEQAMTPLMIAAKLAAHARIAMLRDQWAEAESLANRAYSAALDVNYIPLRVDALGVLVACAARKNRREEQMRLVVEMASLAQAK